MLVFFDGALLPKVVLTGMLALACVTVAGSAVAQTQAESNKPAVTPRPKGFYVGSGAGSNFLPGETVADPGWAHLNPGAALSVTGGFAVGNGIRIESELTFRYNALSQVTLNGVPAGARGNQKTFGTMVNVLYDLPIVGGFSPYVGFGGGYEFTGLFDTTLSNPRGNLPTTINDPLGGFALQGISGFSFPLPGYPRLSLTTEYKFNDVTHKRGYKGSSDNGNGPIPVKVTVGNNLNHSLLFGLRYQFGQQ